MNLIKEIEEYTRKHSVPPNAMLVRPKLYRDITKSGQAKIYAHSRYLHGLRLYQTTDLPGLESFTLARV